ncbi:MAG: DNA translocase FtsK, partial [Bacilli bacterium]
MTKKKKQKNDDKKKTPSYLYEVYGLLLVIFPLIALTIDSFVSNVIKNFSIFLVGSAYGILLILCMYLGFIMIVKREVPKFDKNKFVGFLIISIGFLAFIHYDYVNQHEGVEILKITLDKLIQGWSSKISSDVGGGMIGGVFSVIFVTLFGLEGLKIIFVLLVIVGSILLFNVSIGELYNYLIEKLKKLGLFIKNVFTSMTKDKNIFKKKEIKINIIEQNSIENENLDVESKKEVVTKSPSEKLELNVNYELPTIELLNPIEKTNKNNIKEIETMANLLINTLEVYNINAEIKRANVGPTVTQFELEIKAGTKLNKLTSITKELALSLAAKDVRIEAPIPGTNHVGIEIPNKTRTTICFKDVMAKIPSSAGI